MYLEIYSSNTYMPPAFKIKNRHLVVLASVVVILGAVAVFLKLTGQLAQEGPPINWASATRDDLIREVQRIVPDRLQYELIGRMDMPVDLGFIAQLDFPDLSFAKTTTSDERTAYHIDFYTSLPPNQLDEYFKNLIGGQSGWRVAGASSVGGFAIIEAESANFRLIVTETAASSETRSGQYYATIRVITR